MPAHEGNIQDWFDIEFFDRQTTYDKANTVFIMNNYQYLQNKPYIDKLIEKERALPLSKERPLALSNINPSIIPDPGFNNDKTDLFYFTRSSNEWDKNRRVHLNLYQVKLSEITKNKVPIPLSVNGIDFSSLHPSISKSGTFMYFSSNRPGGYGGMDLYRVSISNGVFSSLMF